MSKKHFRWATDWDLLNGHAMATSEEAARKKTKDYQDPGHSHYREYELVPTGRYTAVINGKKVVITPSPSSEGIARSLTTQKREG